MVSFKVYKIINIMFHSLYILIFKFVFEYGFSSDHIEWILSLLVIQNVTGMHKSFCRKKFKIDIAFITGIIFIIYFVNFALIKNDFWAFPWYYRLFWFVGTFTLLLLPVKSEATAKETETPVERGTELIRFHSGLLRLNLLLTGLLLVALGALLLFARERIFLLLPVGVGLLFQLGVLMLLHRLRQRALTKRQLFQLVGLLEGIVGVLFLIGFFFAMRSTSAYYRPPLLELRSLDLILSFVLFILLVPGPGAGILIYMLRRSQKSSISSR
ncbi:hypothetical protein [Rhodothermus profundi]|uniref:Uncharacterized protein n=1 Tax=Rhodothermus profundi TaxID=633813 RepID=A0A1M6VH17_9BACT|nr:hypothetical protein [Rhodothermus profundi]SHK80661.1 hypothetical protein SAMN04488087_2029 [Rhodothermus profundi]